MFRLKAIAFLVAIGVAEVVLTVPARAEILSLRCKPVDARWGQALSLSIDLAASRVNYGGIWDAQISPLAIVWDTPPTYHYILDRATGVLSGYQLLGSRFQFNWSCSKIATATPIF
jgi:hypothetical protein